MHFSKKMNSWDLPLAFLGFRVPSLREVRFRRDRRCLRQAPRSNPGIRKEIQLLHVFSFQNQSKSRRNYTNLYVEIYFPYEKHNKAIKSYTICIFLRIPGFERGVVQIRCPGERDVCLDSLTCCWFVFVSAGTAVFMTSKQMFSPSRSQSSHSTWGK